MSQITESQIAEYAKNLRRDILELTFKHQNAHLGSCLSTVEIIATLFKIHLEDFTPKTYSIESDQFILSKGHAAVALYSALKQSNFITDDDFNSFREIGSVFEEHPNFSIPTVLCATGSLGHGLPFANGLALAKKFKSNKKRIYVLMSDGECNEGTVWESAQFAYAKNLNNIVVLIDHNKLQATGSIAESLGDLSLTKMFASFGWNSLEVDGHNLKDLNYALLNSKNSNSPTAIICNTIKGKGVSFMENDNNWHYRAPNKEEMESALAEIGF